MKTFKCWHRHVVTIQVGGQPKEIACRGRSNVSLEEARADAMARAEKVARKIAGEDLPMTEDYSADILEQVVREFDPHTVITRTRYGALVLNTDLVTILDVDQPRQSFLGAFGIGKRAGKPAILEDLRKVVALPEYRDAGFRIYETAKGIRLVLDGRYYDPNRPDGRALMKRCHADPLFATLCRRQQCYRARLTPKPHRIRQERIRYRWPMEPDELRRAQEWIAEYDRRAASFAVCRLVESPGGAATRNPVIAFHDEVTKATSGLPLA